jgi:putative transposase
MRSRYGIREPHAAHFVTSTVVGWLPVFTTAPRCDVLIESLRYCRDQKGLTIYGWIILDNHLHAIVAAPDLARVMMDFKRHTARRLMELLAEERCDWLLNQFSHQRAKHKVESEHQFWQEGFHPQVIGDDLMMGQKLDYLHNNPVKRGLVATPKHWRYSSAHEWLVGAEPVLRCDAWR